MFREGQVFPNSESDFNDSAPRESGHVPLMLRWERQYGAVVDSRGFELHDPGSDDPDFFEKEVAATQAENVSGTLRTVTAEKLKNRRLVQNLTTSLGRTPEPHEVARELFRNALFAQIETDERADPAYIAQEVLAQQRVIERRSRDFPDPEHALEAFRDGKARIEENDGITRLIIEVPNEHGEIVEHPVMTDEEIEWVRKSADTIARVMQAKPSSKIFIAGLGLGLLNRELATRGIDLDRQVVAELNPGVIDLVGAKLKGEFNQELNIQQGTAREVFDSVAHNETFDALSIGASTEQAARDGANSLNIRQGDFRSILQDAIARHEQFEAISIDAFPNTADQVNRDASSREVLELALRALKPGGMLTFYPDSRYIPKRVLDTLRESGIPDTSIHYTIAKFRTSEFTKRYHYGDLMAVVHIQKPPLSESRPADIDALVDQYFASVDKKIEQYAAKYPDTLAPVSHDSETPLDKAA